MRKRETMRKRREELYSKVASVSPAYIVRWENENTVPCWGWEGHQTREWRERRYYKVLGIKFVAISTDIDPTPHYEVPSDSGEISFVPMSLVTPNFIPIEPAVYTITHHV